MTSRLCQQAGQRSTRFLSSFLKDLPKVPDNAPVQATIQEKLVTVFRPTVLDIQNDSQRHKHHAAMVGNTNPETHFRITIVSDSFEGKNLAQRHRLIYSLLDEELKSGVHALSLNTKTEREYMK